MKFLSIVFNQKKPVNATLLGEDGSIEMLVSFPTKMPHYKFFYNGFFYSNFAKELSEQEFKRILAEYFQNEQIVTFYPLAASYVREVIPNVVYRKLRLNAKTDPSHYQVPYHTMMTCSFCLAKTYMEVLQSIPEPNPSQMVEPFKLDLPLEQDVLVLNDDLEDLTI